MKIKAYSQQVTRIMDKIRVIDNPMLCYAYGTDASLYRMVPKLVIFVNNNEEVKILITLANALDVKLTFRAAGTSLSGQAVTDEVLVVLSNTSWLNYFVLANGRQIKLEPGLIASHVNDILQPYSRKIGPDPASINSCKIGGIVANNSSGMCCGVVNNTYNTIVSMRIIFANGSVLDSGDAQSRVEFIQENPDIISGINQLKNQITQEKSLVELIQHKFRIKNTTGYSLNAFLDYSDPIDILTHLLVGSEGTLGFISEVTYNTIEDNQFKQVSLIYLNDSTDVVNLAIALSKYSIDAMELLDISSLLSLKHIKNLQTYIPILQRNTAAILIEISATTKTESIQCAQQIQAVIDVYQPYHQIQFTNNKQIMQDIWAIRKGIFPTIGANRISGSSVIIEDIAVDIELLPNIIDDLHILFKKYEYTNAAIFGHILAGNLHFVFTPNLSDTKEVVRYASFMQEMTNLVVLKYRGSLKAEHGCGRNMAPFVELEWGNVAYNLMWKIKNLLDPNNILNPNVILSKDKQLHLKNLKYMGSTDKLIDSCMECGFCESVCPSKNLTLTPRQRITTYRYMEQLRRENNLELYNKFAKSYKYHGVDTCATTGLCANRCPVNIDTGKFILKIKSKPSNWLSTFFAARFSWYIRLNRVFFTLGNFGAKLLGAKNLYKITHKAHKIIPILPVYIPTTTSFNKLLSKQAQNINSNNKSVLYIPSCSNRIMADSEETQIIENILNRLGFKVSYPNNFNNLCCGQVFTSGGYSDIAKIKSQELLAIVINSQNSWYTEIILENSSCYYTLLRNNTESVKFSDIISFIYKYQDKLNLIRKYNKIAVHIDCSCKKIANETQIMSILSKCANEIVIPKNIACCGFAGVKGFTLPELNQSSLTSLEQQIADCDIGVTFNRSCQVGLSFHGGKEYISLPELIFRSLDT